MADGAHQGFKPVSALKVILGGEPSEDQLKLENAEFAEWIRSAPTSLDPYPTSPGEKPAAESRYDDACRMMAKCFLEVMEQREKYPEVPEVPEPTSDRVYQDWVYETAKKRFPDARPAFDGCTGFMFGWAWNAALKVRNLPPVANPAIAVI